MVGLWDTNPALCDVRVLPPFSAPICLLTGSHCYMPGTVLYPKDTMNIGPDHTELRVSLAKARDSRQEKKWIKIQ